MICKPCCDQHDEIKAFVCTSKLFKMTLGLPLNILNHQLVWPWDMQNGEGRLWPVWKIFEQQNQLFNLQLWPPSSAQGPPSEILCHWNSSCLWTLLISTDPNARRTAKYHRLSPSRSALGCYRWHQQEGSLSFWPQIGSPAKATYLLQETLQETAQAAERSFLLFTTWKLALNRNQKKQMHKKRKKEDEFMTHQYQAGLQEMLLRLKNCSHIYKELYID